MRIKLIIFTFITLFICGCSYKTTANEIQPIYQQTQEPKAVYVIQSRNKSEFEKELEEYIKAGWKLDGFTVTPEIREGSMASYSRGIDCYIAIVSQKV